MLKDGKLKWEAKLGEIAEQAHLFLLYKSVLPVSSNAKLLWSRSFQGDAAGGDLTSSEPAPLCTPCTCADASWGPVPCSRKRQKQPLPPRSCCCPSVCSARAIWFIVAFTINSNKNKKKFCLFQKQQDFCQNHFIYAKNVPCAAPVPY